MGGLTHLVLVVDDDPEFCGFVRVLLEDVGYRVAVAETGEEALRLIEAEQPAIVLLDISLPGLNGYVVSRRIRERYNGDIGIIFVSGVRTESFDRSAGLLIGADDYVVKPFDHGEFVARVQRLAPLDRVADLGNRSDARLERLTRRERDVLRLLAEGHDQKQIADELVISPKTVATHIQRVLGKLEVNSRAQAVAVALRGYVSDVEGHELRVETPV